MDTEVLNFWPSASHRNVETEPLRIISSPLFSKQYEYNIWTKPPLTYPSLMIIDADEQRAQRLAGMLTLANYRPHVATTPVGAFKRSFQETAALKGILLGKVSKEQRFTLRRFLQQLMDRHRVKLPIIPVSTQTPDGISFYDRSLSPAFQMISPSCNEILQEIWRILPATSSNPRLVRRSLVMHVLPYFGVETRISQKMRSRNSHFRQMLKAAYDLMDADQWEALMVDVGLAQYSRMSGWPPYDDSYAIPAEYLSCLNQAVAFSYPQDPVAQLRRWGAKAGQISSGEKAPSLLKQQALKFATPQQALAAMLKTFTREMNEIRGEALHEWRPLTDGNFWLIHYSNLYAYGRAALPKPQSMCHAWIAYLEAMLSRAQLDHLWEVIELECSCHTQSGHCLFGFRRRTQRLLC
jgi:hypothetical protein